MNESEKSKWTFVEQNFATNKGELRWKIYFKSTSTFNLEKANYAKKLLTRINNKQFWQISLRSLSLVYFSIALMIFTRNDK